MDSISWNEQLVHMFWSPQAKKSQELYPLMRTVCWLAHTHLCILHAGYDLASKLLDPATCAAKAHVACIEIFGSYYHSQTKITATFICTTPKPPLDSMKLTSINSKPSQLLAKHSSSKYHPMPHSRTPLLPSNHYLSHQVHMTPPL